MRTWKELAPGSLVAVMFAVAVIAEFGAVTASAQDQVCRQPEAVCAARDAVFAISAFDPVGSAVRIGETQLVTSRHTVADRKSVELFLTDGSTITAQVVPSDYKGDVILLSAPNLPPGPVLEPAAAEAGMQLFTVGADVSFQRIRAYDPGGVTLLPAEGKPLARLHHSAHSQPGNSGGALVDEQGRLVGIVAAGGEGRHEAVPSRALTELAARSGPGYSDASAEIGAAVRVCTLQLENLRGRRGPLNDQETKALTTACRRSGNRQLYDLAGKAFGIRRLTEESLALFQESFEQDPHSLNGRIGLAITYHMAARYEEELPHLRFLFQHAPEDLQVLRLAIQAGVWGEDLELAQAALEKLKEVNPRAAPAAERFMTAPSPRPQPR
ncbi:serine protease [Pelagibius sp. Alg239-R121]|uniref:S1 family peptidase n=1 Tax=Pelagibius sp. Alg239-R121 TaxID=2993448 RepID=UPI0024A6AFDA|nr:serine protease [Pelagibius sp. Alg239-R121]